MQPVCPIDQKDDSIQKISAIVAGGSSTGSFSGPSGGMVNVDGKWGYSSGFTTLSGSSITNLAKKLSPPEKPQIRGLGCLWIPIIYPGAIVVFAFSMILFAMIYQFIFGFPRESEFPMWFSSAIPSTLILVLYVNHFIKVEKRMKTKSNDEIIVWEKAFNNWNELFYCHKHDIVFNPVKNETINLDEISKYCGF